MPCVRSPTAHPHIWGARRQALRVVCPGRTSLEVMITVPLLQIRKQTHGVFVASSYVEYVGSWIDGFVHLHQALSQVLGTQR